MLIRISIAFTVFINLLSICQALELTNSEWELMVKQNISGTPVTVPAQIYRECFNDADPIPTSFLNARSCDVIEQHVVHRTVHYQVSCFTEHGSVINIGKISFGEARIKGSSKTDLGEVAGRPTVVRYSFTGRRIGECTLK